LEILKINKYVSIGWNLHSTLRLFVGYLSFFYLSNIEPSFQFVMIGFKVIGILAMVSSIIIIGVKNG